MAAFYKLAPDPSHMAFGGNQPYLYPDLGLLKEICYSETNPSLALVAAALAIGYYLSKQGHPKTSVLGNTDVFQKQATVSSVTN